MAPTVTAWGKHTTIQNRILVYNPVMKPVWTYGIQLWGCASKSNIQTIQRCQNQVLRGIVNEIGRAHV
jgi:hypothetical protein